MAEGIKTMIVIPVLAILAALVTTGVYEKTREASSVVSAAGINESLRLLMPEAATTKAVTSAFADVGPYWIAAVAQRPVAYAFVVVVRGYNGPIRCLAVADTNGALTGLSVLEHHEHPAYSGWPAISQTVKILWPVTAAGTAPDPHGTMVSDITGATVSKRVFTSEIQAMVLADVIRARKL
jgi:Na+-translocating ferredoxin:NAD+ oxidoreductase RnfG subunit